MISKIESPIGIHEDLHFKTSSSKNNDEKSETSLDTEGPTQEEIDVFAESTLPVSQMFPADYPLSSQLYVAQKGKKQVICFLKKCSN